MVFGHLPADRRHSWVWCSSPPLFRCRFVGPWPGTADSCPKVSSDTTRRRTPNRSCRTPSSLSSGTSGAPSRWPRWTLCSPARRWPPTGTPATRNWVRTWAGTHISDHIYACPVPVWASGAVRVFSSGHRRRRHCCRPGPWPPWAFDVFL